MHCAKVLLGVSGLSFVRLFVVRGCRVAGGKIVCKVYPGRVGEERRSVLTAIVFMEEGLLV